jgi:serine/threonine-protein kinase
MAVDDDTLSFEHGPHRLAQMVESSDVATEPGDPTNVDDRGSTRAIGSRDGTPSKSGSLSGYELGAILGRGGMGEVLIGRDRRIGREVAIKRLRGATPSADMQARFMREARIQARLDHPAIVPVYELGYDSEGQAYFTMKRLSGVTLSDTFLAPQPPARPRLLRAFVDICHAVEFAHSRGVVHRDLKPSNIVLGKFNEVYVLDWGLARLVDEDEKRPLLTPGDIDSLDGLTQAGALLGTPGYMAPEQARGEADIDRPADIYALGSILFEILSGETLHPKGDRAIASTIENLTVSPTSRRQDRQIAPELDAICAAALATEPEDRPTAGDLAERIQRFLDGDRDVERRLALAAEHLAAARSALAGGNHLIALRAAGRALALDPESRDAADLVTGLMLEPPAEHPLELRQALEADEIAFGRKMGHTAGIVFAVCFMFLPFAFLIEITNWWIIVAVFGSFLVLGLHAELSFRHRMRPMTGAVFGMAVLIVVLTRLFSPIVFVPGLILAASFGLATYPRLIDRPKLVLGVLASAFVLPMILEAAGVWSSTWTLDDGSVKITSAAAVMSGPAAKALIICSNLGLILIGGWFARSIAVARRNAQHSLAVQAWHLRQLLPHH